MSPEIINFIQSQRVCVIALEMLDGSPHAATVHFAFDQEANMFLFETCRDYRKAEPLFGREISRASLVIGFDESNMKTLQIDGEVKLVKAEEQQHFDEVYYGKFPTKKEKNYGSPAVFFSFTPTWWRYTDWTKPEGKFILSSDL